MIDALRSEWIKLRTIRMNWVLLAIAVAFPPVVSILTTALQQEQDVDAKGVVGLVSGTSVVTALLLGVIGATAITGEFGFGTIRPTFAAMPRRWTVITAKAIVTAVVALAAEAVVVIVTYVACAVVASNRDRPISLSDVPAGAAPLIGVVVFAGIVGLLGYGLGLLIRNTPATVAVLLVWPLVIEGLLAALLGAAGVDNPLKFMPYNSGIQLGNPDAGTDPSVLSRVPAGLYFGTVTAVILVVGALLTDRRDA
jgi:ABC-2 type transport system permease protein